MRSDANGADFPLGLVRKARLEAKVAARLSARAVDCQAREQAARCFTGFAQRTSDGRLDEPDWGLHPWPAPAFQRGTPG